MANPKFKILILMIFVLLGFTSIIKAQDANDDAPIKVDTILLNIPVIVSDRDGRYISGLKKENFIITQDGKPQTIDFFADDQAPMNVAVVIDLSGSTSAVLGEIKRSARDFIKILRPEDKAMIVGFAGETIILSDLTSDQKKLTHAINGAGITGGGSAMQDAIYEVVTKEFAPVKGRKAIIVLTDGMVYGHISNQKLLDTLIESDILVYPIFFQTVPLFPPNVKTVTLDQLLATPPAALLNSLALATGGRFYAAHSSNFKDAFESIAGELKEQYLVGFYPQNTDTGKSSRIKIDVDLANAILRTKRAIRLKMPN